MHSNCDTQYTSVILHNTRCQITHNEQLVSAARDETDKMIAFISAVRLNGQEGTTLPPPSRNRPDGSPRRSPWTERLTLPAACAKIDRILRWFGGPLAASHQLRGDSYMADSLLRGGHDMRVSRQRGFQRSLATRKIVSGRQALRFLTLAFLVAWLLGVGTTIWAGEAAGRLVFQSEPRSLQFTPLEVRWIAFSPDGKLAATAHGRWTTPGCVRLWDVAKKTEIAEFPQQRGASCVAFSADSKRLAFAGWDGTATILDIASRETVEINVGCVSRVAFSPDGKTLATATEKTQEVTLWDAADGDKICDLKGVLFRFQDVCYSPDGKVIAAAGGSFEGERDGRIALWNAADGKQIKVIEGHDAPVCRLAFAPDGATLASASLDRSVCLWNIETGQRKLTLGEHDRSARSVSYSPDGGVLATAPTVGQVRLWDATTGGEESNLEGPETSLLATAFSPDGKILATGGTDGVVRLWDMAQRREAGSLVSNRLSEDSPRPVLFVTSSPDGTKIASAHQGDPNVRVRDAETGRVLLILKGHEKDVSSVAFSPDGKLLASASCDGTIRLWDAESGAGLKTLKGHTNWVLAVAFSPDGKTLASGGRDKTVRLWQVSDGKTIASLEGHSGLVRSVAFSPNGTTLATASADQTVRIWDAKTNACKAVLKAVEGMSGAIAFSPDGKTLAGGGKTGVVTLWDAATGKVSATLDGQGAAVWCLVFSPQGGTLATAGTDGKVLLWDIPTGEVRTALEGQDSLVTALTCLADGTALVSGAVDGSIHRWDAVSPALAELSGPGDETRLVLFSPDGGQLVAAGVGSHVVVYDLESGTQKYRFRQSSNAYSGDISSDGKLLAVSGREILLANLETGKAIGSFGKGEPALRAVAFTPDAKTLVAGNDDGVIQVWDVATKRVKKTLPQQPLNIYDLAISPDGKTLATAMGDYKRRAESGEIKLWDLESGKPLQTLPDYSTWFYDVDFTPDGEQLIFSDSGGTVRFWDIAGRCVEEEVRCDKRVRSCELVLEDRPWLAAAGDPGRLTVWDMATSQRRMQGADLEKMSFSVDVSPDGSVAVTGGADPTVRLWALPTPPGAERTMADRIRVWGK